MLKFSLFYTASVIMLVWLHTHTNTHTEFLLMPFTLSRLSYKLGTLMQEEFEALTFKQFLCSLLVVNTVAENGWNIDRRKKN